MQGTIPEASQRLAQLIQSVRAGEDVVIAEGGEPVARLVPASQPNQAAQVGHARAILDRLSRSKLPDESRRSGEEIDAAIAAERAAWD